ncbi:exostosin [Chytriomyces sp. MP71]|nr:exostosin [Chytriomyces sp. MP71]
MKIKTFNCYFELVQGPESLLSLPVAPHCFDKCTLIMNVYDRTSSLLDRIRHYHTFAKLDSIIIVWNHQTLKPPQWIFRDAVRNNGSNVDVVSGELNVPLHILLQSNSSLNNRYIPFREIHTDCVISMDDDFDYPHRHLDYAIQLFQGEFFNNLIGFKHMARAHRKKVDNTWEYLTEIDRGMSMVLPTGAVFHRKYLEMYSFQLPSLARDIVDSKNNGEDILFNMMVANATGMAPVVVNLFSRGIKMPGLWKKAGHFESRSLCLTRLINEIFGGRSPLKYSFSTFRGVDKDGLTPSLKELQSYDKVNWIR